MTFIGKSEHQRRLTRKCRSARSLCRATFAVNGGEVLCLMVELVKREEAGTLCAFVAECDP